MTHAGRESGGGGGGAFARSLSHEASRMCAFSLPVRCSSMVLLYLVYSREQQ